MRPQRQHLHRSERAVVPGADRPVRQRPTASYCSLLDGAARTIATDAQPGTTLQITANGLAPSGTPIPAPTATTTSTTGTTSTTALGARSARAVPAVPVPSECTDAGLTTFAESVQLTAATPRFVAAEDRPGATGPFLVVGTDDADTTTGSGAGDCVVGAGGADTLDGAGGGDALIAGDGAVARP
ncbi:hypothetical protein, partial [Pseudonocardia humida]|nr:hypothetical protein [Pseudonocardia humida]